MTAAQFLVAAWLVLSFLALRGADRDWQERNKENEGED